MRIVSKQFGPGIKAVKSNDEVSSLLASIARGISFLLLIRLFQQTPSYFPAQE
jgi:hypothetical protein